MHPSAVCSHRVLASQYRHIGLLLKLVQYATLQFSMLHTYSLWCRGPTGDIITCSDSEREGIVSKKS